MPKRKKIKPAKAIKPKKPRKETKLQKAKKDKLLKFPANQIENLKKWMSYYEEHKKLPHSRIICSNCQMDFISMKGVGIYHAMKNFDNDVRRILTESVCKSCKKILNPKEEVEKSPKVIHIETPEEIEARRDKIRATIPKIDFNRVREPINLKKDKEACAEHTHFACNNPQVYLDLGCASCSINKYCACPIKDVNRIPDGRAPKFKKAVIKPK